LDTRCNPSESWDPEYPEYIAKTNIPGVFPPPEGGRVRVGVRVQKSKCFRTKKHKKQAFLYF
jgi:hypothetical protein